MEYKFYIILSSKSRFNFSRLIYWQYFSKFVNSGDGHDFTLIPIPIWQNIVVFLLFKWFNSFFINIPEVFLPSKNISLTHFVFNKLFSTKCEMVFISVLLTLIGSLTVSYISYIVKIVAYRLPLGLIHLLSLCPTPLFCSSAMKQKISFSPIVYLGHF